MMEDIKTVFCENAGSPLAGVVWDVVNKMMVNHQTCFFNLRPPSQETFLNFVIQMMEIHQNYIVYIIGPLGREFIYPKNRTHQAHIVFNVEAPLAGDYFDLPK